jgi:hypothetical protein
VVRGLEPLKVAFTKITDGTINNETVMVNIEMTKISVVTPYDGNYFHLICDEIFACSETTPVFPGYTSMYYQIHKGSTSIGLQTIPKRFSPVSSVSATIIQDEFDSVEEGETFFSFTWCTRTGRVLIYWCYYVGLECHTDDHIYYCAMPPRQSPLSSSDEPHMQDTGRIIGLHVHWLDENECQENNTPRFGSITLSVDGVSLGFICDLPPFQSLGPLYPIVQPHGVISCIW